MVAPGTPRSPRRRQVRWARSVRRLGLAWQNALEIARAGRLTAPYGAPFEVVHAEHVYRLRRYQANPESGVDPIAAPLLLIPPLMVASEIYDVAPDVSAVAALSRWGVDVWLVDFGAPEREQGGMERTLDDHVRAVSEAVDRVRAATGNDVHLAGYSQGGMFCYQAAAFRRSRGIASVITMGSPVDLYRSVPVDENVTGRIVTGMRAAFAYPLSRVNGLPKFVTANGFKLLSVRKEAMQLIDFVKNLHDRSALEKREAKRLFLGGGGFVAWPGPAFRKFVDELIIGNRMQAGGFVIDGHTVTLADVTCPVLYFLGSRDEMGRPAAVRGIKRAAPKVTAMYEVPVKAGHFGLVVGTTALTLTWPGVVTWMRWREGSATGPPEQAVDVRAPEAAHDDPEVVDTDGDGHDDPADTLDLAKELVGKTAKAALERVAELSEDLGAYLDNARWQLPRLQRLRHLQDDSFISFSRSLAEQAHKIGDRTFFLFRGRAFTYADANRRVDAVVKGLIACGVKTGTKVGVMMTSRPSHLSVVTAVNRLGAVAVLLSPETPDAVLPRAVELGEAEMVICDPQSAARARAALACKVLVLGGVGEVPWTPGEARTLPAGVVDMESIDPESVAMPTWYRPDSGRARDLAMVFVSSGKHEPPRAMRITNRRWAFSALGAAAAATLTTSDTVYCCLPLHHPSGMLVAAGSALVGGARLALATRFDPTTFWDEVRRYGVSVVYYAGEMCRRLVDAPAVVGENNNPVRLFAGSGMRRDVWRRLVERFGPVGVLELYASTEANTVLANARGKKIGSVGRALPGSPDVTVASWSFERGAFERDGSGHVLRARIDEPGMLIAQLSARAADLAYIDPSRLIRDAFHEGDIWFVTGEVAYVDTEGDFWLLDRANQMVSTRLGPIAAAKIEDALYDVPGVAVALAVGRPHDGAAQPIAAIQLATGATLDLDAMSNAITGLPEYGRPRSVHVVESIPVTDGYRVIRSAFDALVRRETYAWDPLRQRLTRSVAPGTATNADRPSPR